MANWRERLGGWIAFGRKGYEAGLKAFIDVYGANTSSGGKTVTWQTALAVSTVLACARVLMEGVAQTPFRPYLENESGRVVAKKHRLYRLLVLRPNPWQSGFEFIETVMLHLVMTHNAFVFMNKVGMAREIREMIPIEPGRVVVKQLDDMTLEYHVTGKTGQVQIFKSDAIWHLRGPSWNSWLGLDATKLARNSIGLAMAIEESQAEFHENGAKTSGLLSVKETLSPEKFTFLSAWLDKHLPGGERASKPLVLDQDGKYTPFNMSGVDAQTVETRKLQVEEICRQFRVMPIMVGAVATPTYASAEQMFIAHVVHTLSPWYERIEHSANVNLLTEAELEEGYYLKFSPNALMRGAAKDRGEFYAKALGTGGGKPWMTQNEVRGYEELDRSTDPEADKLTPVFAKTAAAPTEKEPSDA
ncbi:MAG: phage portal protein [Devosia sp.]